MPLTIVRQESASRFQEVRTFLSAIKTLEQAIPRQTVEVNVQKGLFLVLLYGAFEYSLTRTIIELTLFINSKNVNIGHINAPLYALALDPQLNSCAQVGRDLKWKRRVELFQKQTSSDIVFINESPFLLQMENIWAETISRMFEVYALSRPPLYSPRVRQYIDEVVDKRNAVAHGRESAAAVGQSYTGIRLQNLLDEISRQVQYVFTVCEDHINTKAFVNPAYQALY